MPLLNKVTKSSIVRGNTGSRGHWLLLNGPKGGLEVGVVSKEWLGRGTRSGLTSKWEWRRCGLSDLSIVRCLLKVTSVKVRWFDQHWTAAEADL